MSHGTGSARGVKELERLSEAARSAANSVVRRLLGVTVAPPEDVTLIFERFISKERGEPVDIDVDFEHERREEVIQHIYERYGRHRAGLTATVIHFRARAAIREIGLDPDDRRLAQTVSLMREIIGFPRHLFQHVGGFVITERRLDELCPIENAAMEARTVIEWDKDDIDALGAECR